MRKKDKYKLKAARRSRFDEFYTRLPVIEKELAHYGGCFAGNRVYCNCDDPRKSNFVRYFLANFKRLGIKKLTATCYSPPDIFGLGSHPNKTAAVMEYGGTGEPAHGHLNGDGDFRSPECAALLKESDIVVTNPPFSIFNEYMDQLVAYNKKFLIIGNQNAIAYKGTFPLLKNGHVRLGPSGKITYFNIPKGYETDGKKYKKDHDGQTMADLGNGVWFTNIQNRHVHGFLSLTKKYNEKDYPTYDNYNAVNVDRTCDIPYGYGGEIGVPVSFMLKYNTGQFVIKDILSRPFIGGKCIYKRLIVRNKTAPCQQ